MNSIYQCPVCNLPLNLQEQQFTCTAGHCFDIARQGYVNLLLAHHKKSADPGDDKGMVANRRAFLETGHYDRLATALADAVYSASASDQPSPQLLDAGCGEGFYLRHLAANRDRKDIPSIGLWGLDISKHAVSAAAQRDKRSRFCVGSNFRLPVRTACLDSILQVFAPGDPAEYRRVLKPNGRFIAMTPGPEHLFGLKKLIYDKPQKHPQPSNAPSGFKQIERHCITYSLVLNDNLSIQRLLSMTPYYWHLDRPTQERALAATVLETNIDAVLSIYQPIV
jgi:23S rRNA (guanine745-N1)-methyltransferase